MTEKRFTHKKWYDERQLFDGDEAFAIVDSGTQASIICNRLNQLSDENEQLKKENKKLKQVNEMLQMDLVMTERKLTEENEQLKSELRNLRRLANEVYMEKTE